MNCGTLATPAKSLMVTLSASGHNPPFSIVYLVKLESLLNALPGHTPI
jgi:hypothetical protein